MAEPTEATGMPLAGALQTLNDAREGRVVVTTMSAAREWPRISDHPLDLNYLPSAMGQGLALGLGVALARPEREVVVLHGDGATLMSLGSLVTVAASGATNITVVVVDNGVYEVTGGQRTAGASCGVDFAAMARAAGFVTVGTFDDLKVWRAAAAETLQSART